MSEQPLAAHQPRFASVIPLRKRFSLDPNRIVEAIASVVDTEQATISLLPGGVLDQPPKKKGLFDFSAPQIEVLYCAIGDIELEISSVPARFSDASIGAENGIAGLINPAFWSDGLADVIGHRAHVTVRELRDETASPSDAADLFDRAAAVSVVAASLADLTKAEAVIWVPARNLLPQRLFGQEVERLVEGVAPLRFWVRWHVIPVPPDDLRTPGVATHGLADFAGIEIIAPPSHADRDAVIEHVFALSSRIVDEQEVISDDSIVGEGSARFTVSYAPAGKFCETRCIVLDALEAEDAPAGDSIDKG